MSLRARLTSAVTAVLAAAAVLAAPAAAELSPDELLATYQPVLQFDATDRFGPTAVDGFVAGSDLLRLGESGYESAEASPAGLPVHGDGWRLDRRGCTPAAGLAAVPCYDAQDTGPTIVYGRHDVRGGTIVLQYWLFYELNFWSLQYPPSGFAWQSHEGDWEVVTIVLDEEQSPVEVAYSQHCGGERRSWSGVQKVGTHPIVYVATGSHANLFAPGVHAISLDCYPQPIRELLQRNNVTLFDFVLTPGRTIGPGAAIERIHDNAPRWVRYPGTWGETQFINIPPPLGFGVMPFGLAPVGPQLHDVWVDPLGTIGGYPVS